MVGGCCPVWVLRLITPPEALPYRAEKGPRSTSTLSTLEGRCWRSDPVRPAWWLEYHRRTYGYRAPQRLSGRQIRASKAGDPGVVLTVLNLQPGYATKGFRQVNAGRGTAHIVAIDDADRGRSIKLRYGLRRGADDHGLFLCARGGERRKNNRNQQQRERSLTGRNDFHE